MASSGELLSGVHLDKSQVLGEGAFGVVYRGRLGDAGVAIKTIKANSPEQAAELEATLLEEAAVWAAVQHPNVVQFYGVHKDAEGGLYLVSELMDGSVEGLLHEDGERVADGEEAQLTARQQLTMCLHVACALQRLHQLKILHSDLAARNVLYKRTGGGELVFKVTDFGLATVGKGSDGASASASRSYQLVSREQVPVRWCAPEVLKRQLYSPEADVWSLGVYMWEVFSLGELPYGLHMTNSEIYQQITPAKSTFRLEKPEDCKREVFEVMASCWQFGRKLRATLPEIEGKLRALRDKHMPPGGRRPSGVGPVANRQASPSPARQGSPAPQSAANASPATLRARGSTSALHPGDANAAEEFYSQGRAATAQGNTSVALEFYRQGAELGHPGAQSALGQYYLDGKVIRKNETLALDLFRKAAVQGDPVGMVAMGDAYKDGIGDVVKSLKTAFEWYQKATEKGVPEAFYKLSQFYHRGLGVPINNGKAFEVASKGSQVRGGGDCFDMMAYLTLHGLGMKKEPLKAMDLYKRGIAAGSLMAECSYAGFMLNGYYRVPKDAEKAVETLERGANAGVPSAMGFLATRLVTGADGIPKNLEKGIQWIEKAANAEDLGAMSTLGLWLVTGSHVSTNVAEGIAMLESAAKQGYAEACLNLGNIAQARDDVKLAIQWWQKGQHTSHSCCFKAAKEMLRNAEGGPEFERGIALMKKGVSMGSSSAAYALGSIYCNGSKVPKNVREGAEWLKRGAALKDLKCVAALGKFLTESTMAEKDLIQLGLSSLGTAVNQRHPASCIRLAELYSKGRFVKEDKELAKKYVLPLAEKGMVEAQLLLGEISDELEDPRQAVRWYEKAARQKCEEAAFRLAEHVENGNGAAVNLHTAMAWYTRVDTAESHYRQGLILMTGGSGVTVDQKRAAAAFKRASDKGHREATYRLGVNTRDGLGVTADKDEAVRLLTKAADDGHPEASFALGNCYQSGYGNLKKNKKVATYYFEAAASTGHEQARAALKRKDSRSSGSADSLSDSTESKPTKPSRSSKTGSLKRLLKSTK